MNMQARRWLGCGIALSCLVWAWRATDAAALGRVLRSVDTRWLLLAVLAFGAGYGCRAVRWSRMLHHANPRLAWWQCIGPLMAGVALNNLFPLRAGDVFRATASHRQLGVPTGTVVASLVAERLFDVIALAGSLAVAVALTRSTGTVWAVPATASCVALICAATLLWSGRAVRNDHSAAVSVPLASGHRIADRVRRVLANMAGARRSLGLQAVRWPLAGWTVAAWTLEGAVFWCAGQALPSLAAPDSAWLAMPAATLATMIPGGPGHVGTFDVGAMQAMALSGNSAEASLAFAALVHVVVWLPATLVGAGFLLITPSPKAAR
jgi:uncharacterized protein (TIRG00374 family)